MTIRPTQSRSESPTPLPSVRSIVPRSSALAPIFALALPLGLGLAACGGDGIPTGFGGDDPSDPAGTEEILLEVPQWNTNHNGGGLTFDNDGFLHLGLGDGGGSGDNEDNGQDATNLLGTILRLEVLPDDPFYRVPADNPFTGDFDAQRDEIFAYGLRNPWRVTVDPETNTLWIGDVGQNAWEEVDTLIAGGNYGWDCREGAHDFAGTSSAACDGASAEDFIDPIWEYAHEGGARSITGGYVYRGTELTELVGRYVYGDFITGQIWALDASVDPPSNELLLSAGFGFASFGVGLDGELYVLQFDPEGGVYRLESDDAGGYQLVNAFPDLTFEFPVDLRPANDGSGRLFVVERRGTIRVVDTESPDASSVYLDISDRVTSGGEQGLLGLALHPDFASNGYFYAYYTTESGGDGVGRLSRFTGE